MFPDVCLYLTKNKQTEVIHENSEDLNQTKLMLWARVRRRASSWDLGIDSKPFIGTLAVSDGYGKVLGRISSDGKKGWRLDYDPKQGMHINVFEYTKGKGDKVIKEVIPFNGNKDDLIHMDSLYIGMVKII